jgi:hypothetical protein
MKPPHGASGRWLGAAGDVGGLFGGELLPGKTQPPSLASGTFVPFLAGSAAYMGISFVSR